MKRPGILLGLCIAELVSSGRAVRVGTKRTESVDASPRARPPHIDPALQAVMPIEWVHGEKTGVSFLNTLIHLPGVCPDLPTDYNVNQDRLAGKRFQNTTLGYATWERFSKDEAWKCNASAFDVIRPRLGHGGIEKYPVGGFNAGKGRFMIMMRQPEQRFMSFYAFCKDLQHNRVLKVVKSNVLSDKNLQLDRMKTRLAGPITKMLTRATYVSDDFVPPTSEELERAKLRLRSGFSFVGITEHWNLSMCLFNTMFNQPCRSDQFGNVHPTNGANLTAYDTSELKGWRDPYDNDLYGIALQMFAASLAKYRVNPSSCESCWREAGVL